MTFWNRTGALLCALALSAVAAPTVQADEGPFYVSVSGMWVIPGDSDASVPVVDSAAGANNRLLGNIRSKAEFEDSFGFAAAFGYGGLTGLRGELEVSYRSLDLDKVVDDTVTVLDQTILDMLPVGAGYTVAPEPDADLDTWSVMANAIYAFDAMGFRPYVGAGIGLAEHEITTPAQTVTALTAAGIPIDLSPAIPTIAGVSDDDTVFAWQLMVGVGYAVSDSTEIRLGYRYFDTADADFDGIETSFDTHNIELGIVHCF